MLSHESGRHSLLKHDIDLPEGTAGELRDEKVRPDGTQRPKTSKDEAYLAFQVPLVRIHLDNVISIGKR